MDSDEPRDLIEELYKEQKEPTKYQIEIQNQYWSQHKLTLIAYQLQYVKQKETKYDKKNHQNSQKQGEKLTKKRKDKYNFDSGFLEISPVKSQFEVRQLIFKYPSLQWLFKGTIDIDLIALREFIIMMLELKHGVIVKEFCFIYDWITKRLIDFEGQDIFEEKNRFDWIGKRKLEVIAQIEKNREQFPYLSKYFDEDRVSTQKLLMAEIYCLLAEKYNFSVNQFYKVAFSNSEVQKKPIKRLKRRIMQ